MDQFCFACFSVAFFLGEENCSCMKLYEMRLATQ